MKTTSRHDVWGAGGSYDAYMGRWSRQIAPRFLDWLEMEEGLNWLEVGCGTGALSAAICERCRPRSLIALDPSEDFLAQAKMNMVAAQALGKLAAGSVEFRTGDSLALDVATASRDVVASGLMLNFVADMDKALAEMRRVARSGGTVGLYVWDYPGGGVAFMRAFWQAASALDPGAIDLTEDKRFPFCTQEGLIALVERAGLAAVRSTAIEVPTVFADFEDYWRPFTLGAGPAPGYCASLAPEARQRLQDRLQATLPYAPDGSIPLAARAWALAGTAV